MGVVRLSRRQAEHDDLPRLCLRCGKPATVRRGKTFSKSQGWTFVTIFLGGLPYLLCCALFRDRLRVRVPLCDGHRNHFRWQAGILWGGVVLVGSMFAASLALIGCVPHDYESLPFQISGGTFGAWMLILLINRLWGIAAASVNDREAVLVGVSNRFAKACEESRAELVASASDDWK